MKEQENNIQENVDTGELVVDKEETLASGETVEQVVAADATETEEKGSAEDGGKRPTMKEEVKKGESNEQFYERKEVEKMMAEAEERGYRRGKNEKIEFTMQKSVDEALATAKKMKQESDLLILRKLRGSCWRNGGTAEG